mgnify:CR=1 FL=1
MGKFQMKGRADIRMKDKEITELAKANSRWDHKKIILLSFAVALSVFVLFSAFSIAKKYSGIRECSCSLFRECKQKAV